MFTSLLDEIQVIGLSYLGKECFINPAFTVGGTVVPSYLPADDT